MNEGIFNFETDKVVTDKVVNEVSEEKVDYDNFDVGEKVRICNDVRGESRIFVCSSMIELQGKIVTIEEFNGMNCMARIEEDNQNWDPRCFIKLEPVPVPVPELEKIKIVLEADTPTDEEIERMISLVDLKTFVAIINNRLDEDGISETINEEKAKKYLKNWAKAKYRLYKLLGNKLFIETKIEEEKNDSWYKNKTNEIKHKFPLYSGFLDNISSYDIKENCMTYNSANILFEDERVKKDMKFTRVVALFKNNDLNMEISKLYQDKSMKNIKVSIDPCDYLTVSINRHNWRSCHNFFNGEYRNAGLSLMHDKTSLVSYSATENINYPSKYPFTWNSKNWRQMIYISEDNSAMIFSLQYPNYSDQVTEAVRSLIEKKYSNYLRIPDKWRLSSDSNALGIDVCCSDLMYEDTDRDGCKYIINKFDEKQNTTIKTGANAGCFRGNYNVECEDSDIW